MDSTRGEPRLTRRWHAGSLSDVFAELGASKDGLSTADARARLAAFGPNTLPASRPMSAWRILASQLRSVVVLLLVATAIVAALTSDTLDAAAIGAILLLNVALGFAVEMRARRAVDALTRLEPRRATALRDRAPIDLDARELVPGDVMLLDAGQLIAADARLLTGAELRTNESALTGESLPVTKNAGAEIAADTPLPDRRTMVFAGTVAVAGAGRAIVVCTGSRTELGAVGQLVMQTTVGKTPLERRLDVLGRQLVWVALGAGGLVALVGTLQGAAPAVMLETALALAVAAVPEGLPAVATIALALGVHRMARRHALVRRLPAVEALGAVTVICTDKTGTLTSGSMTVTTLWAGEREFAVEGVGYAPIGDIVPRESGIYAQHDPGLRLALEIGALANHANVVRVAHEWIARGDPTEAALVTVAQKCGIARDALLEGLVEVGEVPFSSERKWMAMFYRDRANRVTGFVKGAPHKLLDLCDAMLTRDGERPLDAARREAVLSRNHEMARQGLRVLALAYGTTDEWHGGVPRLTFVGLAGMMDPPAESVRETIRRFRDAGITTVMLTGDQRLTAEAVARDLGLTVAETDHGAAALEQMSDADLDRAVAETSVFSRVSPALKLRIVAAYQRQGHSVAMLGDGVNDAAALKKADVGVTMGGRGTDVARETADVVLQDDRFETIGAAIEDGRVIFDNIRKFVFYLFSCNLAEIAVLFGATAAGQPVPLTPIQILWLNLVTDTLPALALVLEPAEPDVMRRPPRDPVAGLLSRSFVLSVVVYAGLIALATFIVIAVAGTGGDRGRLVTMTFTTLGLAQAFHLGNARSRGAVVRPRHVVSNRAAVAALALTVGLIVAAVHWRPLAGVLGSQPLDAASWMIVLTASVLPAIAGQIAKIVRGAGTASIVTRVRHYIRDLVYGANDGIIITFAVVAGVTGGALSHTAGS